MIVFVSAGYLAASITTTGVTIVCNVFVLKVSLVDPVRPMPKLLYAFIIVGLGTLMCYRRKAIPGSVQTKYGNKVASISETSEQDTENVSSPKIASVEEELPTPSGVLSTIKTIKSDLHELLSMMQEKEQEDELRKDWKLAAQILDRVFLIIFIVCHISILIIMYFCFAHLYKQ